MPLLLLVRHGETDWNRTGQIMGARPVPLNPAGQAQARRLAGLLRSWFHPTADGKPTGGRFRLDVGGHDPGTQRLITSPVVRTRQTADLLSEGLHLHPCLAQGLSEIGVGEWEGRYWRDLSDDPVRRNFYSLPSEACPPGGETLCAVQARAVAAVERAGAGASAKVLVAVSHADVIRSIIAHYLRLDIIQTRGMNIDHASLTALDLNLPSEPRLLFLNFVPLET